MHVLACSICNDTPFRLDVLLAGLVKKSGIMTAKIQVYIDETLLTGSGCLQFLREQLISYDRVRLVDELI